PGPRRRQTPPRAPPSFPCSLWPAASAAPRAEQFAEIADLLARFRQMGFKSAWLPHLELLAEADKSNVRSDAGVLPEPLRQDGASVLIDRKDFACADKA